MRARAQLNRLPLRMSRQMRVSAGGRRKDGTQRHGAGESVAHTQRREPSSLPLRQQQHWPQMPRKSASKRVEEEILT